MRRQLCQLIALLLWPAAVYANAGLPMLMVVWPPLILALVPVVLLESWVVCRTTSVPWRSSLWSMSKANLISTLVGVPLTWVLLAGVEIIVAETFIRTGATSYPPASVGDIGNVILSAAWLGPWGAADTYWVVPVAVATLLVPFFFVSAWVETLVVKHSLSVSEHPRIRGAVWRANLVSYAFLFICCVGWLVYELVSHGRGVSSL